MAVELFDAVSPIYMVGESHSLVFSNLLFRPDWSQQTFLCRTRFFSTLEAAQYSSGEDLDSDFAGGLTAEGILDSSARPAFRHTPPSVAFLRGVPVLSPPIVLFAGDLDMHQLFRKIGNEFDFMLPEDPGYSFDLNKQLIPYSDVHGFISSFLSPFFKAVTMLQDLGFHRMMIHCLPPRTRDDAAASNWTAGIVVNAPVRAKLTLVANRLMQQFCTVSGVDFIDTWPDLTSDGFLRPEFELDGAHINRRAALISLDKIVAQLFDNTADAWNGMRYQHAFSQADERLRPADGCDNTHDWERSGLIIGKVDGKLIERALAELNRDLSQENRHARPDWVGRPRAGLPGVEQSEPSEALLADAAAILGGSETSEVVHAGAERELTITSLRPIRYARSAEAIEPLPCPPGTRRGLIALTDTTRISFSSDDGSLPPIQHFSTGTIVVYDPERVRIELSKGEADLNLIELAIGPRLSGQPFRAIWAGLCDWPADPYCFSLSGMKAVPAIPGAIFKERARW